MTKGSVPKRALEYMNRNDSTGRVLNSFYFGQYIIWKSSPTRTVFIDDRAYLSADLLEKTERYRYSNPLLDMITYGFQSILVDYPEKFEGYTGEQTYDVGFSHPRWSLGYWDDISMFHIRRNDAYRPFIERMNTVSSSRTF